MGQCCITVSKYKSNVDDIFDELLIREMRPGQIRSALKKFGLTQVLVYSKFVDFCEQYCISRTEFNAELLLFWVKYMENKAEPLKHTYIMADLLLLSKFHDNKLKYLIPLFPCRTVDNDVLVDSTALFEYVVEFVRSFTVTTLAPFKEIYDDKNKYEYEFNAAFTEKLRSDFIEARFFAKFGNLNEIPIEPFFKQHFGDFSNIPKLRQDLIEFAHNVEAGIIVTQEKTYNRYEK